MLQYKTVPLRESSTLISKKDWDNGFSLSDKDSTVSQIEKIINDLALSGWTFHSVSRLPMNIKRKKTILEKLFGWIPIINTILFKRLGECYIGVDTSVQMLIFVKEV